MRKPSILFFASLFCFITFSGIGCRKEPDEIKPDMITLEGTIKRSMLMGFTESMGELTTNPPSELLVASDGMEHPLLRMPNCKVTDKPSTPGVIQLGAVGEYRCKGYFNEDVFEAHEIVRLD